MSEYDYSLINRRHIVYHGSVKGKIVPLFLVMFAFIGVALGINESYKRTFLEPKAAMEQNEPVDNLILRFETQTLPKALVGTKYTANVTVSSNQNLKIETIWPDFPGVKNWGGECELEQKDGLFYYTCPFSGIPVGAGDYPLEFRATSAGETIFTTLVLSVFSEKAIPPKP